MEGGYETASGEPIYTFEDWLAGKVPYVTGATNRKDPSLQTIYRNFGDYRNVPVRITDYGPGVKGIDIASSNKAWATNFPYQGSRESGDYSGYTQPVAAAATLTRSNSGLMSTWQDYATAVKTPTEDEKQLAGGVMGALSDLGKNVSKSFDQSAALKLLSQSTAARQILAQLAADPRRFLNNPYLGNPYLGG